MFKFIIKSIKKLFISLTGKVQKKIKSGFTLIEIMIAMALFGLVFGFISNMMVSALNARKDALITSRGVLLAERKMNEVKQIMKEDAKEDEFPDFPGYTYSYQIVEEELDLLRLLGQAGDETKVGSLTGGSNELSSNKPKESVTGGIIKIRRYTVTINHISGYKLSLNYFRILGNL